MDSGWIKLHRKIVKNKELWGSGLTFGLFVYLLLIADRKTGMAKIGRFKLAKRFRAKPSTIYQTLKRLESNNQVTLESNNKNTEVFIKNWRKYQVSEIESNTESSSNVTQNKNREVYNKNIYITLEEQLKEYKNKFSSNMLKDFYLYWKEDNGKGKERWQLEKTWNVKLRLERWKRNQEKRDYERSQRFIKDKEVENKPREGEHNGVQSIKDLLK